MAKIDKNPSQKSMDRPVDAGNPLKGPKLSMAQQIAEAASAFETRRTGIVPTSVSVVQCDGTLVITLHGALSPAERTLAAQSPEAAARVQEFHRQLFASAADSLRQDIKRITGVAVREAAAEIEPESGTVVGVFTSGTTVQVYLLTRSIPAHVWNENTPDQIEIKKT